MKRVALIAALIVSLAAGSAAMADPGGRGHRGHREPTEARHHEERHGLRRHARVVYGAPFRRGAYHRPHGYYPHRWARGERIPVAYYARPFVIVDYRVRGLRVPPRGYHWVRVDGDAVLAAVTTGLVLDTVFHVFD